MERKDEVRIQHRREGIAPELTAGAERSFGELFNRLATDTSELIREEMSVANVAVCHVQVHEEEP